MWFMVVSALALAQSQVDWVPALRPGKTYLWTHLITVEETSQWGSVSVTTSALARREVELGGRLGRDRLEWVDRVEDLRAEMKVGTLAVGGVGPGAQTVRARELERFEALQSADWRVVVKGDGTAEAFELRGEGDTWNAAVLGALPSELADVNHRPAGWSGRGPTPPEWFFWATGLGLQGVSPKEGSAPLERIWTTGETARVEVGLPLLGLTETRAVMDLQVETVEFGTAEVSYRVQGLGTPPADGRYQLRSLRGTGRLVLDIVHGEVLEHHQDLNIELLEGRKVVTRHEQISSFLNRVKNKPPRKNRTFNDGNRS